MPPPGEIVLVLGHDGEPVAPYDARVELDDVTLGELVTLTLFVEQEATVTLIEKIDEGRADDLHSLPPVPVEGQRWRQPFLDGEVGFVLRLADGREAVCLVWGGEVYQLGGTLRVEYALTLDRMRQGWKSRRRW